MNFLYDFPGNAAFGKVLPKNKIYGHASPTAKVRDMFVREVKKIVWSYKLSPETINLPARDSIQEIQVFTIVLKTGTLKHEVLWTIDKVIPSPIFFVLEFEKRTRYAAAYKRQSEADERKWVVSRYFESDWFFDDTRRVALPVVLDLGTLYHAMLGSVIPLSARKHEIFDEFVFRAERLNMKEQELVKLEAGLKREKQFNRKVEINAKIRYLKKEIEEFNH
ncbi:DUF4391 domain-containing protein [Desulfonema magnum]|uniref:DUF4391 n=1 Tax=Desulfonema magnum TaxID=45655 RepID=A0A975GLG6_9BACT|nr:DUF4391 domain-containing protein [Desulfonema magnum]QTA85560.1 DUF4391 [Desulfonema magnum]